MQLSGFPLWFLLIILGLAAMYIYIVKMILQAKEEDLRWDITTEEDRLKWEISKTRFLEIVAWIFMTIFIIIDAYGILNLNPPLISAAGLLIVVSYLLATHYRKRRFKHRDELERKSPQEGL